MTISTEWKLDAKGNYLYFDGKIEKPDNDKSEYRLIKLVENDFVALLIHNDETDTASAAMDVHVGSLQDPADLQGLAHFIEHLVFMGTEKFPKENEFDACTSAHSGGNNAYTNLTSTTYYFQIAHDYLEEALDRFAQLFICPLISRECIAKEIEALHSEYKQHGQKDAWRVGRLIKALANPKHPYSQLDIGSRESLQTIPQELGIDVREKAVEFFKTYYSANLMKLCIMGRESLDDLAELVVEKFKDVPNTNIELDKYEDCAPMTEAQLKKQVFVKPVEDGGSLYLIFPISEQHTVRDVKPYKYINFLIDYEGPGSLQSYLKGKAWANYITGDTTVIDPTHSALSVYIDLTKEGEKHYEEVIAAFFKYIALIKKEGVQEYIFKDIQSLASTSFRFQDSTASSTLTSFYSSLLKLEYPPHRVLSGICTPIKYDAEIIQQQLGFIRADNFSFFLVSDSPPDGVEFSERERWFGAEYSLHDLDDSFVELLNNLGEDMNEFALPVPNKYIPANFETSEREVLERQKRPDLIEDTPLLRLWHKRDDTFWTTKAHIWMLVKTPLVYKSPYNSALSLLYTGIVTSTLSEHTYDARLAGLYYSFEPHPQGLLLCFGGYSETLPLLVDKVLQLMRNFKVDPKIFKLAKENLIQSCKNFSLKEPSDHADIYLSYLTDNKYWLDPDRLPHLETITREDLEVFYPTLLSQVHIEALAHGNLTREKALEFLHRSIEILSPDDFLPRDQFPLEQGLSLPQGERWIYKMDSLDPENVNSAVDYLIQVCKSSDVPLRNRLKLLRQMVSERFFNQLRTKEQLGYAVGCYFMESPGYLGLDFCVQSERDSIYLESRIDAFVQGIEQYVRDMTEEEFKEHVQSRISTLEEKSTNAAEEGQIFWAEISPGTYDFEWCESDIIETKKITKDDMLSFIEEYIDLKSPTARKLSVHVQSQKLKTTKHDMVYAFLVSQEVSGLVVDDVQAAMAGDTYETIEKNLRQLLNEKCQVESAKIDQLMATLIENASKEQESTQFSVNGSTCLLFPSNFVDDIFEFKKHLILTPRKEPASDFKVVDIQN